MAKKLYVGNLNYITTEEGLRTKFAPFGEILSVTIIKNPDTQQSKGFGFVELSDERDAATAIAHLNGREIDGRRVRVSFAEEKPRRPPTAASSTFSRYPRDRN